MPGHRILREGFLCGKRLINGSHQREKAAKKESIGVLSKIFRKIAPKFEEI